jgi:hypothetical protein
VRRGRTGLRANCARLRRCKCGPFERSPRLTRPNVCAIPPISGEVETLRAGRFLRSLKPGNQTVSVRNTAENGLYPIRVIFLLQWGYSVHQTNRLSPVEVVVGSLARPRITLKLQVSLAG